MAIVLTPERNGRYLWVLCEEKFFSFSGFENGFVKIEPVPGGDITTFAKIVEGILQKGSNFERIMREKYDFQGEMKGVKFCFNDIPFTVEKGSANANSTHIVNDYFKKMSK